MRSGASAIRSRRDTVHDFIGPGVPVFARGAPSAVFEHGVVSDVRAQVAYACIARTQSFRFAALDGVPRNVSGPPFAENLQHGFETEAVVHGFEGVGGDGSEIQ